jgi:hypothetical protein
MEVLNKYLSEVKKRRFLWNFFSIVVVCGNYSEMNMVKITISKNPIKIIQ